MKVTIDVDKLTERQLTLFYKLIEAEDKEEKSDEDEASEQPDTDEGFEKSVERGYEIGAKKKK
jgi:hypothetical protein